MKYAIAENAILYKIMIQKLITNNGNKSSINNLII